MKHVFVETNFLVELLRPFPARAAGRLFARNGKDATLYVPWVSLVEAKRTLDRIIQEDLGFPDTMMRRAGRALVAKNLSTSDHKVLVDFARATEQERDLQLGAIETRLDDLAKELVVIEPDKRVIEKTLRLHPVKSLKPFDEMVLGAVLVKAADVRAAGASAMYFCNLNKNDFDPKTRPTLAAEYAACGVEYLAGFAVP